MEIKSPVAVSTISSKTGSVDVSRESCDSSPLSEQLLVGRQAGSKRKKPCEQGSSAEFRSKYSLIFTVFLLCFINALNYINRYTLPPIVGRLKVAYKLSDMHLGLIQTSFEIVYVVTSPLFGYLGDRWNRKYILAVAITVANISGLSCSFVPESSYAALLATRAALAMAEAAYSNIAPAIIADMFVGHRRTVVITLFQFAIPIGCGLGYILGSAAAELTDDWRWAFRLTPVPVAFSILLMLLCVREPERGEAENAVGIKKTNFCKDLVYILKIPSFMLTTLAFIGVAFATGALCYWTPFLITQNFVLHQRDSENHEIEIGTFFGVITIVSGMAGVVLGAVASNKILKPSEGPAADGIVCGFGILMAAPLIYGALMTIQIYLHIAWVLIFFGIACLCCCWVLISEITLNVVIATRRATANAFSSTVAHLLGDAASPYIIGLLSDTLRRLALEKLKVPTKAVSILVNFTALKYSLFVSPFVIAISGGLFLIGSLFLNEDTCKAKKLSKQHMAALT